MTDPSTGPASTVEASFCPLCGVSPPRHGNHKDGCPYDGRVFFVRRIGKDTLFAQMTKVAP